MSPFDELVLTLTMSRVQALERLDNREYSGSLNTAEFYELLRTAGYSDDVAQKAASRRGWERLSAGVTM